MSHELEGSNMFSVRETPWHGLGTILNQPPTVAEGIKAAGLDWSVELRPLMTTGGLAVDCSKASVRASDNKVLGVVGNGYTPLQNAEAFGWFDPFLMAGEATLETAGSLRGGSRIWVLAKLSRDPSVIVKGDEVNKFILLANSHDGTLTARVGFVPIRVVCANTLAMATSASSSKLVRIRHQKNVLASLDALRDVMNVANADFEATAEQYRRLAGTAIVEEDLKRYVKSVFSPSVVPSTALAIVKQPGIVIDGELIDDEVEEKKKSRVFTAVQRLFEQGHGAQLPGVRGTLWAAYNAVTEYLGYERGSSRDTRVDSLWFQDGAKLNARALQMASAMAA